MAGIYLYAYLYTAAIYLHVYTCGTDARGIEYDVTCGHRTGGHVRTLMHDGWDVVGGTQKG